MQSKLSVLEMELEKKTEALSELLSYEEYLSVILLMLQHNSKCITGFRIDGDIRVVDFYSFDDEKMRMAVILPDKELTDIERNYLQEEYQNNAVYDYRNDNKSWAISYLFYEEQEENIIPVLQKIIVKIKDELLPGYKSIMDLKKSMP